MYRAHRPAPDELTRWLTGNAEDVDAVPTGPGLILMGGGAEPDAAFTWWVPLLAGGDVVVLRASGEDGYNDYLYADIGGVDSVETLRVDSVALAQDPYVSWQVAHAEGVFIAGGDQWDFLSLSALEGVITDTHFRQRDRMGRLVAFVARMWVDGFDGRTGLGVDEATALLIGPDGRQVVGEGAVYQVESAEAPQACEAGRALEWDGIEVTRTTKNDEDRYVIRAGEGRLWPGEPY